jgi:hypothetical protein
MDMADTKVIPALVYESKSFHTVRILHLFKADSHFTKNADLAWDKLKEGIFERVKCNDIKYYIDFFLKINQCYSLFDIEYQRSVVKDWNKVDLAPLNELNNEKKIISHPVCIIIGSIFDEKIDNKYREVFQINQKDGYKIVPTTYYGFHNFKRNREATFSDYLKKKYIFLLFQVSGVDCSKLIENPKEFYSEDVFNNISCFDSKMTFLYFGLLKGDIEGFVLIELNSNCILNDFIEILKNPYSAFFKGIRPLSLFECSWVSNYEIDDVDHFTNLSEEFDV